MKQIIIELFTKRMIDYTLMNWIEFIILFFILAFIYALLKTIFENIGRK